MSSVQKNNKRRIILILSLLLVLFPISFFLTKSVRSNQNQTTFSKTTSTNLLETQPHATFSPTKTITLTLQNQTEQPAEALPISGQENEFVVLSMKDGFYRHLFVYQPETLSLYRFTNDEWDDITPSVSPDGMKIAFSSNRDGFWDIFILDLQTEKLTKITDSSAYDAQPTWSPDGMWLAYESYLDDNLEILITSSLLRGENPIRLTNDPAADHSPAWAPEGRAILFVSDRTGDDEIWIADLDALDERFRNISQQPGSQDTDPAWSHDGNNIAWSSQLDGSARIILMNLESPVKQEIGLGQIPIFNPGDDVILAQVNSAEKFSLCAYSIKEKSLVAPPKNLFGLVYGLSWVTSGDLKSYLDSQSIFDSQYLSTPLWNRTLSTIENSQSAQYKIVALENINAPYAFLHDSVDEAFQALRKQVESEIGWNFLDLLENAYIPLTEPPSPDMQESWLYTGRAIAVNPMPLYGSWMVVVHEEFSGQTFWRIYLKTRYQDGSQGMPIKKQIWDFAARYSGDPNSYEAGGQVGAVPVGYWVDFTEIALWYGWERLPSLSNWRTYFSGTLFNQYVLDEDLDWLAAMLQLYPSEALATATPIPTITMTPKATPPRTATPQPTKTKNP